MYQIISGERRLIAAQMAGLAQIPCIIFDMDDKEAEIFEITENFHRLKTNYFDVAERINALMNRFHMTPEEISERTGIAATTISDKLRVLKLPEDIKNTIIKNNLSQRHALILLQIENNRQREMFLREIIKNKLNADQAESLVKSKTFLKESEIKSFKSIPAFISEIDRTIESMRNADINIETEKKEANDFVEFSVKIYKSSQAKTKQRNTNEIKLVK